MRFLILLLSAFTLYAASFNCQKASTKIEKTICHDKTLSHLDSELAKEYKKALKLSMQNNISKYEGSSIYHFIKQTQKKWLKNRNKHCSNTPQIKKCLLSYYNARIKKLQRFTKNDRLIYMNFGNFLYNYTHKPFLLREFRKIVDKQTYKKLQKEFSNWEKSYDICKDKFGVINEECAKKVAKEKTAYYNNLIAYYKNNKKIGSQTLHRTAFSYKKDDTCYVYNIYPTKELQKLFKKELIFEPTAIPKVKDPIKCNIDDSSMYSVVDESISYINKNIIVLKREEYDYSGGAHGDYYSSYYTFDRNTGKEVKWSDLFGEKKDVLFDFIVKKLREIVVWENYTKLSDKELYKIARNWHITKNGIVFKFSLYEIAPYADGEPSFLIPLNVLKQAMSKEKLKYYFAKGKS